MYGNKAIKESLSLRPVLLPNLGNGNAIPVKSSYQSSISPAIWFA